MFEEISTHVWDACVRERGKGSPLLLSSWGKALSAAFPFVTFQYYRYNNDYTVRFACIGNRLTSAPFSEGGEVVGLADEVALDAVQFSKDIAKTFQSARLRINERMCALENASDQPCAYEHVVSLSEPLLPRVRKTLRHVMEKGIVGAIEKTASPFDKEKAYQLYLAHMRRVANLAMSHDAFEALFSELAGDLWVYRAHDDVEAMAVFLVHENEVLYALSASNIHGMKEHAPHHLVFHALQHYQKGGVKQASLGTTGVNSPLETFKRGWRGSEYRVYEIGGDLHERARTSPLRKLVRLVPLSLYPLLTTIGNRFL